MNSLYGNNIEAVKAIRVNVPLYYTDSFNDQPNARYYFPETPELNGKTIVGIKLNAGTDITIDPYGNVDNEFDLPFDSYQLNTRGVLEEIVGPRGVSSVYNINTDIYLFITLYNEKKEQVICNYPVHDLASYGSTLNLDLMGKIRPFETKIDIRSCYISSTGILSAICSYLPTACFTFFYK
jgi:hypothetical protein